MEEANGLSALGLAFKASSVWPFRLFVCFVMGDRPKLTVSALKQLGDPLDKS